jgi:hypothetical protein
MSKPYLTYTVFNMSDVVSPVLHPGMKMKYFRDAPWAGDEYIEEAKSLAQAAFGTHAIDTTCFAVASNTYFIFCIAILCSFAQSAILIAL